MHFFFKTLLDQNLRDFGHGTRPVLVQNAFAIRVTVNAMAVAEESECAEKPAAPSVAEQSGAPLWNKWRATHCFQ